MFPITTVETSGHRLTQLEHHNIPVLQEQQYDAAGIHVGINDLLKNNLTKKVSMQFVMI